MTYDEFRTGLTFRDVRQMLWSYSEDPKDWPHITRRTVLGKWREIKLMMWEQKGLRDAEKNIRGDFDYHRRYGNVDFEGRRDQYD